MAEGADISLDEVKARHWIEDVNQEIENVRVVLSNVSKASTTTPGEDDTIMQGIESLCNSLDNFWDTMCKGFKEAGEKIVNVIDKIVETTNKLTEDVDVLKTHVGK